MAKQLILVVEDDERLAHLFKMLLEEEGGYDCETVGCLADAKLRVAKQPLPTCVLLDLKLPNGAGMELVNELDRHTPTIPIVVISGFGVSEKSVKAAGGQATLQKPVGKGELLATVANTITEWHGNRLSKLERSFDMLELELQKAYEKATSAKS